MESLSDIVAQMRGRGEDGRMDRRLWLDYADRIEAAAKLDSAPTGERLSTVGAEICEALEDIFLICCKAGSTIGYDVACGCIKSKARHALSSRARIFDMSAYAETVRQAWLEDEKNWDEFGSPKLELHEWILSRGTERKEAGNDKS